MKSIIDNKKDNLLVTEVNKMLDVAEFSSMAVGYFYLSGFEAIREKLHKVQQLKLVIGTRTNTETVEQLVKGHSSEEYIKHKLRKENRKNKTQKQDEVNLTKYEYAKDLTYMEQNEDNQVGLSALWELIKENRIDIRVYTKGFLHSKAYIFDAKKGGMVDGVAIVGSSNLSISGLSNNTELNVKITNQNDFDDVKKWFDDIWNNSEPFSDDLMDMVEQSWVQQQATPYEIYIKTLYNLIKERVQIKEHHISDNSAFNFNDLYLFQKDAVNMALNKLENENTSQNGVFISDVVGLGKSYIALAIISWYWSQKRKSTLIVCPASLKQMWLDYKEQYQLNFHILSSSELLYKDEDQSYNLNDEPQYDGYEVVIIDEAHHFRNPQTQKYQILAPYLNGKKVILLTATPQNKTVWDIYHQIKLFHQSDITDLNIAPNNLKTYFETFEAEPQKIAELLQNFVIRRTRNDLKNNPKYASLNLTFPKRNLKTIEYEIDASYALNGKTSIYASLIEKLFQTSKSDRYQYSIYALTSFLKKGKINEPTYQGLSHFGDLVRGLLKMLLFKRLESSAVSFLASLERMIKRNEFILRSVNEKGLVITGRADQLALFLDDDITNSNLRVNEYPIEDFRKDDLVAAIMYDISILKEVRELIKPIVNNVSQDAKFNQFIKTVIEPHRKEKILIFSEFTETVEYLYKRTKNLYPHLEIERISSSKSKREAKDDIVRRFSPISQTNGLGLNDIEKEIQILFTSDVLSEGQNLQDAHIVVNYDFHWNPVRLIQRIGRIDRIGSTAKEIKVFNFLPDDNIEQQLDLRGRVHRRINEIHQIFGSDSAILSDEEQLNEDSVFSIYSDMSEDILDVDGGISTIFDEAEKILNQLEIDDKKEYNRIINLEDGIRTAQSSKQKGTFAFLKAGNLNRLYFENGAEGNEALGEILKRIKAEPSNSNMQSLPIEKHTQNLKPIYKKFKEEIKKRQLHFSSTQITSEQKHFQQRLRDAYNLFNVKNDELKPRIDKLNTIFQKEIPDYSKSDLRSLKKQKLSDELMIEALEQLVHKSQIEKFQKQAVEMDAQSIKTICSESFI
ncbi:helicase-related protein [Gillisia sp. JM1]|uniref:helicase-related protein n=1 Tax=Gillisia sp. JM1 TaxID=1283286 RepID=UPI000410AD10|nr:helicase-related protein [Gillisia sp. JM1]